MMEEVEIIDQLIEALTTNQEILDSNQKLKSKNLRELIGDLNYSFLEILKNIKDGRESRFDEESKLGKKVTSMFA